MSLVFYQQVFDKWPCNAHYHPLEWDCLCITSVTSNSNSSRWNLILNLNSTPIIIWGFTSPGCLSNNSSGSHIPAQLFCDQHGKCLKTINSQALLRTNLRHTSPDSSHTYTHILPDRHTITQVWPLTLDPINFLQKSMSPLTLSGCMRVLPCASLANLVSLCVCTIYACCCLSAVRVIACHVWCPHLCECYVWPRKDLPEAVWRTNVERLMHTHNGFDACRDRAGLREVVFAWFMHLFIVSLLIFHMHIVLC